MNNRLSRAIVIFLLLAVYLPSSATAVAVPEFEAGECSAEEGGDVYLQWFGAADTFNIYYSTTDSFPAGTPPVSGLTGHSTTVSPTPTNTTLYFWVEAVEGIDTSQSASISIFSDSSAPNIPALESPADEANFVSNSVTLSWNTATDNSGGSVYYQLSYQKSGSSEILIPAVDLTDGTTSRTLTGLSNGTYSWKVRSIDDAGNISAWGTSRAFYVNTSPVTLLSPADGSVLSTVLSPVDFSWQAVTGYDYEFTIYESDTPLEPTYPQYPNINSFSTSDELVDGHTYQWTVKLWNGSEAGAAGSTWIFTIDITPPGTPTNLSPSDSVTLTDSTPQFTWDAPADADTCILEVASDIGFTNVVYYEYNISGESHQMSGYSLPDGTYHWRVRAVDEAGNEGDDSATATFSVDMPPPPVLVSPSDGSTTTDTMPTLNWNAVPGTETYRIEYSTSATFATSNEISVPSTATSYTFTSALADNTYYWRVKAVLSSGGETTYPTAWRFTVEKEPPVANVSFSVVVKSGSSGDSISSATVRLSQGTVTLGTVQTDTLGRASFSAPAGTYTLQVTKNLWDNGAGSDYIQSLTVSTSTNTVTVLLYEEGRDLIIATVRYNDSVGSQPDSIIVYRNGSTYMTVTLPRIPPGILPASLVNARTNLVLSVPETGSYTIADPEDPEGAVPVSSLSSSLASSYNNAITLSVTSSVTGLIVDEQGNIVTGASVWLLRPETDGTMSIIGVPVESSTIGFIFNYILPASYKVKVTKAGFDDYMSDAFAVGTNETKNVGMIVMTQQKGTLNITVQDAAGDLLSNARVTVENTAGTTVFNQLAPQGIVGTELAPGSYTVSATLDGYEVTQEDTVIVSLDTPASATVIMDEAEPPPPEKGSFELTLADADGNPLQLVEVFIGETKVGVTNQEGVLLLEDLDPGTYTFTFTKAGYVGATATVDVVAGETAATSTSLAAEPPVDTGSGTNYLLYGAIALVVIVVAGALLFMKKRADEEGSIISDGSRPASGPRSMPPPETFSAEEVVRPKVLPKTDRGLPMSEDSKSGLPVSPKKKEQFYSSSRSSSGIPNSSIKDDE